jgi:hypothetical protein
LAEVFWVFLLPWKIVTDRFENNKSNSEMLYLFLTYDKLFNILEDVLLFLESSRGLRSLPYAPAMANALHAMKAKFSFYYDKTSLSYIYADSMLLNLGARRRFSTKKLGAMRTLKYMFKHAENDLKNFTGIDLHQQPSPYAVNSTRHQVYYHEHLG